MPNPPEKGPGQSGPPTLTPAQAKAPARTTSLPAMPSVVPAVPSVAPVVPKIGPVKVAARPAPRTPAGKPAAPPPAPAAKVDPLEALGPVVAMLDELDYFQLLKVPSDAPPADIKRAFYAESRNYHPDRYYHLSDSALKAKINELYKRVTEAYYVLRDDSKRRKYAADVSGPERKTKLRFTEVSEAETKQEQKRQQEEQIGVHPKGRQFYQTGMQDYEAERWAGAERNFKMALTYEPQNPRYKERLAEVRTKLDAVQRADPFKIK